MRCKVLFTSDMHGNEVQYRKLVDFAIKISADAIIMGGDIAPKHLPDDFVLNGQRCFLEETLPNLLGPVREKLENTKIFLIMGNDDCAANLDVLTKVESGLFEYIHMKRIKLTRDFDIVGYSFVPITPFGIKDWEKYDFSEVPKNLSKKYGTRKIQNYRLHGFKTEGLKWKSFVFTSEIEQNESIQKDLSREIYLKNPERTVYVTHAPPDDTKLDILYDGSHAGSMAIRYFIEKYQPYLTLHGHIHETVKRSGNFNQKIGETLCFTAGNHNIGHQLAVLVFDLYNPLGVTRKII